MKNAGATILVLSFVGAGLYVGYKNHTRDGFWKGALATALVTGVGIGLVARITNVKVATV